MDFQTYTVSFSNSRSEQTEHLRCINSILSFKDSFRKHFKTHFLHPPRRIVIVVVCLSVSNFVQKLPKRICIKFSAKVGNGPANKWLNFGGDLIHGFGSSGYRDTGETCLGGGMHCHSASSFSLLLTTPSG